MSAREAAIEAGAKAWFDRQQAQRRDSARINEATGRPFQWDELYELDRQAYRVIAEPIVDAGLARAQAWLDKRAEIREGN